MNRVVSILFFLTISLSFTGCWLVAAGAGAEAAYVGTQEERGAGETISDQLIVANIKTQYMADPDISALQINIDSFKGAVRLTGQVKSGAVADKAIAIAERVTGVTRVDSRLTVY